MSTRQIKDAKDLSTNELIYFKGHAQATYMSDGRTVEEAITSSTGGSGGTIDTSNLATKTELAKKQDIISDIDTIRTNAANYKGTVTSVKLNGVDISPSSGVVDLGYIHKKVSTFSSFHLQLSPNVYYRQTIPATSLTFTLSDASNTYILNEYFVEFTIADSGTTVSFPASIRWANGRRPEFEPGCTYQISIVNNLGTYIEFI